MNENNSDENTIFVLKGIDIQLIDKYLIIDMDKILENKLSAFMEIARLGRKVISYDEYLALYELVLMQYRKIVILENNLFINYYPLHIALSNERLKALEDHFDEEKEGEAVEIGNLGELTAIYGNIKKISGRYYVSYNNTLSHEKEVTIKIYEKIRDHIEREKVDISGDCYEVLDEEDYITMMDDLFHVNKATVYILEKNTSLNKVLLEEKVGILKFLLKDKTNVVIGFVDDGGPKNETRPEFFYILKEHWGHDSFRRLKTYNIHRLGSGEKEVEEIEQSRIITNIVVETEKCMRREDYRDIFVTAPTGAGKSVIFQIPAIYLAENYQLFTIVISPLIGLMKDQVANLEIHRYHSARTINSDISPIQKQEIINDIADKKCNILYISPESLLSKSDLDQIIGDRTLGLLVVDEAHIVTTWGKQFRPDYWYLGDHLNKIKKAQITKKGMGFVLATFTATAIYGGLENMYEETIQSLKMIDPITYLGYIKRDDIDINIEKVAKITGKTEYELNKFDQLVEKIDQALMLDQKMLVYFPTVALINRFWEYCGFKGLERYVTRYHGQLGGYEKEENYKRFLHKEAPIMLATKAFGMGIDIDDIEIVAHFAPTGNVCDYVQEIGRAARRPGLRGEAFYKFMANDFKHINRLHGLSVIKEYQLIEVIRKVYELHQETIKNSPEKRITKKRNEMLVDAENFSHIFENPFFNEDDGINKVKTAMLLIQKDFERRFSFSPFYVRPIPLFETGFFMMAPGTQKDIKSIYGSVLQEEDSSTHVCSVNLKKIWEYGFSAKYSFPRFKFMLYSRDKELAFTQKDLIKPALRVTVDFQNNYLQKYDLYINAIKKIVNKSIREEKYYDIDGDTGLVQELVNEIPINVYKARSIVDTILSAMSVYQRDYCKNIHARVLVGKTLKSGDIKYRFMNGTGGFFKWVDNGFQNIMNLMKEDMLYLIDDTGSKGFKESLLILGVLETLDILIFEALGGKNSQLYIYVNQTKTMKEIIERPSRYHNKLIELVNERHEVSVEMLTYIFEGAFENQYIWELIENYFLGIIPKDVIKSFEEKSGKKLEI